MKKETQKLIIRGALISLIILAAALLQNTAGAMPAIRGARIFLLIPAVICAGMFHSEASGAAAGLFGGALWDLSSPAPDGFNALFLCLTGFLCAFLIRRYMRNRLRTALLFCTVTGLSFILFQALIYSYYFTSLKLIPTLCASNMPSFICTLAVSPLIYLGSSKIFSKANITNIR